MKYVSWIYEKHQYKHHIISKLSPLQIKYFIFIFNKNKSLAEYILINKLYNLFDIHDTINNKYTNKELIKLHMLAEYIPIQKGILLCTRINIDKINKYNVIPLLQFIDNEHNFINKKINIVWGPGNHGDLTKNVTEHFKKHVMSEMENKYWSSLLPDISYESYKNYAIKSFYKMKKVIIHSNGKFVYLSGFYNNVFIVGRYQEKVFGISSCYYVENGKKNGRKNDMCFKINFNKI